jgi:hypothetical protein
VAEEHTLGPRGQRLRDALVAGSTDEARMALAEEAGRLADRLDDIDAVIAGKGVLSLLRFRLMDDEGRVAEVKFDAVLSEARQQQMALRQIVATLGLGKAVAAPAPAASPLDQLAARRADAARRAGS